MNKKILSTLVLVLISMFLFSSIAYAGQTDKLHDLSNMNIIDIEPVPYESLPQNVKKVVDRQQKIIEEKMKIIEEKEKSGDVTIEADYFASASISAPDSVDTDDTTNIYVTTSSYPGGLWAFETVDLDGTFGVYPYSPDWDFYNSNGVQWSWGSLPFESKTVKMTCEFTHAGDYKLHVWGGAAALSHADDVNMLTAQ